MTPAAGPSVVPVRTAVCAVVVTYRPDAEVTENIEAIARQTGGVIIVHNEAAGLDPAVLAPFADRANVELIVNPDNCGIAEALNQGAARARALGYEWIATFDQDSQVPPDFIAGLLAAHAAYPGREQVAVLAPLYRDRSLGFVFSPGGPVPAGATDTVAVSVTATSGNLVKVAAWQAVQGFRADFFIDCVDFEFCLRCRRAGWQVLEVRDVILDHAAGRAQQRHWLWKNPRFNDYDAGRRYYQARNRLIMQAHFLFFDPRWILSDAVGYGYDFVKLLLFCQDRGKKLRAIAIGVGHAMIGRRGRWPAPPPEANGLSR